MVDQEPAPIARLLAAVIATHEAFRVAARAAGSTGFATEFAQRAEYQERIASHFRGMRAPVGLASDALWRAPTVGVDAAEADRPRLLFDHCLRMQDAATLEFCRGYGPHVSHVLSSAMRGAFPRNTSCQPEAACRLEPSPVQGNRGASGGEMRGFAR